MAQRISAARAFTLIELTVIVLVVVLIVAIFIPAFGKARTYPRQLTDTSQIRGITQAMVIWGGSNKGSFPLPAQIDLKNETVADAGAAKNTSANIMSLMIWNGSVPTDLCISPQEANPSIRQYAPYEFQNPRAAVVPENAAWDPAFTADFTGSRPGGLSYANLIPTKERLPQWSNSAPATTAVFGNRGPEIGSVRKGGAPSVTAIPRRSTSITYLIHGPPSSWEGNIGYADAHVDFVTHLADTGRETYKGSDGFAWSDVLFYDEPDDASRTNAFLGIFTTAGDSAQDFRAIWD